MSSEKLPIKNVELTLVDTQDLNGNKYDIYKDADGKTIVKLAQPSRAESASTEELPVTSGYEPDNYDDNPVGPELPVANRPRRTLGVVALTTVAVSSFGAAMWFAGETGDRWFDADADRRGVANHLQNIAGDIEMLSPFTAYDNFKLAAGLESGMSVKSSETTDQ